MTLEQMKKNELPSLETRMLNILRRNSIPVDDTKGMYKAALNRLVKKGVVTKTLDVKREKAIYKLSTSYYLSQNC